MNDSGELHSLSLSLARFHLRDVSSQMFDVCECVFVPLRTRARQKFFYYFSVFVESKHCASLASFLRVCKHYHTIYLLFMLLFARFAISISRRFGSCVFKHSHIRSEWLQKLALARCTYTQFDVIYHINKTTAHTIIIEPEHFATITIITMI